jgi:YD repeat-containing protein
MGEQRRARVLRLGGLAEARHERGEIAPERVDLVVATGPYGTNAAPATRYYLYDALGNLVCRDGVFSSAPCLGAAATFAYPTPGPGVPRPHAPLNSSLGAVAHDAAGNLTALGPRSYEYDLHGQLVRVRDAGALRAELFYDGTGRLVRLTDSATGQVSYRIAPDFEWNQQRQIARRDSTYSRRRGTGALQGTLKRRSLCPLTCDPSPSRKRPPEWACRSHAVWATTIGLRGNATQIPVESSIRSVASAANPSGANGSFAISADISPS